MVSTSFPLRPLWLSCDTLVSGTSFPTSLLEATEVTLDLFCMTLKELGYNALLFGAREAQKQERTVKHAQRVLKKLNENKVQVILKPSIHTIKCPLDLSFSKMLDQMADTLSSLNPSLIFWESGLNHPHYSGHPAARDATLADLVLKELEKVEDAFKNHSTLVFYLPCSSPALIKKSSSLLEKICHAAGKKTNVAFSSLAGEPSFDHLPLHPFWERLNDLNDPIYTPLMPLVNLGGASLGGGGWPSIPYDHYDRVFSRMRGHCFAGAISLAEQLPKRQGFTSCNLWVGAHLQINGGSADILIESWFKTHRSSISYEKNRDFLKKVRSLVLEISHLRSMILDPGQTNVTAEEGRLWIESLSSQLKILQFRTKKEPIIASYLELFAQDAKKMMVQFAQHYNITANSLLLADDPRERTDPIPVERLQAIQAENQLL